jgi:hypothetical protein
MGPLSISRMADGLVWSTAELNWKTEVLGENRFAVPLCLTLNDLGLNPGLCGEIPGTVNFDTALTKDYRAVPFREYHIHPLRAMPQILC